MIEFDSRRAWRDYLGWLIIGFLLLPAAGLGLVVFLYVALNRYGTHYTIQHERIQTSKGIVSKNERSVRIENIRDLWLDQSVMQRILGVGSLGFSTSGSDGLEVVFKGIEKPRVLKERIESYLCRNTHLPVGALPGTADR